MQDRARIVLTFDDGREDNYGVFMNILCPRLLPASIYIATGYIRGECGCGVGQSSKPLTISEITEIDKCNLFEVGAHSDKHCNDLNDIKVGKELLLGWINRPLKSKIGFASHGSVMSERYVIENKDALEQIGLEYVRTGSNFQARLSKTSEVNFFIRRIFRYLLKKYNNKYLYALAYGDSFIRNERTGVYTSFPVLNNTSLDSLKLIVDKAIKNKSAAIFMFHSIKKNTENDWENMWSWDYEKFVSFSDFLCEKRENGMIEVVALKDLK